VSKVAESSWPRPKNGLTRQRNLKVRRIKTVIQELIYPAGRLWMMEKGKVSHFGGVKQKTKTPSSPKMAGKVV